MSRRLAALGEGQLRQRLRGTGLTLRLPPFVVRLQSDIPRVARDLLLLYADFELGQDDEFVDFHLAVRYAARPSVENRAWRLPARRCQSA